MLKQQPDKFVLQSIFLITAIAIIYAFVPTGGAFAKQTSNWQKLSDAPAGLLERVQKDYAVDSNLARPIDVGQMLLLQVQPSGAKPLFLIDTRLPGRDPSANPSCGQAGCLFYGYIKSGTKYKQVLNGYINDFRVQNAPPPIQPVEKVVNQLPCLQLTSYQSQSNQLLSSQLCFDGNEYQPSAPPRVLKKFNQ